MSTGTPAPPLLSHQWRYPGTPEHPKETILLIHGALASHHNWDGVAHHLASQPYHLLIPDLPCHGAHAATTDDDPTTSFTLPHLADALAALLAAGSPTGTAHVVGHSLGAHVAVALATAHPARVRTLLVSGFELYPGAAAGALAPGFLWAGPRVERLVPAALRRWALDGKDDGGPVAGPVSMALCRAMAAVMTRAEWPRPWPARTLVVAAGRGSWALPTADRPADARRLAEIGREANARTRAVVYPGMRHAWTVMDPEECAALIVKWIEDEELPSELRSL
jgi:pimeloyl-ACP methyl ester carboxylesterase